MKTDINLGHKGQAGGRHQNKPTKSGSPSGSLFLKEGGINLRDKFYKKANLAENKRLIQYMSNVYWAASFFQENFVGKKVVYKTASKEIAVYFTVTNFMHLCGLTYSRGTEMFFRDCLEKKVDIEKIGIKRDGTSFQKLQMLSSIHEL